MKFSYLNKLFLTRYKTIVASAQRLTDANIQAKKGIAMRIIGFIYLLFFSNLALCCQLSVRMANYGPESELAANDTWKGVDVELIEQLFKQVNCRYSIVELPWARSLQMLARGDIDIMLNVTKTKEREQYYYFVGPIKEEVTVLAKSVKDNSILKDVNSLMTLAKPVAVQRGSFYGPEVEQLMLSQKGKSKFIQVASNETKIKLMETGRISGFLAAKRNLTIGPDKTPRYKGVWFHPLVIYKTPVYFALSKKSISKELLEQFNRAVPFLIED
ncbi:substrate-binding periplasmic protein [Colwelliaceae bacterium 6441]